MQEHHILVVEDDPIQQRTLRRMLERDLRVEVTLAANGHEALAALRKPPPGTSYSLALVDLSMPLMDGKALLREAQRLKIRTPFVVLTASEHTGDVVEVMKLGALDFITKPIRPERLSASVQNVLALSSLQQEVHHLRQVRPPQYNFASIQDLCPSLREVVKLARKGAKSGIPILITGESGVGKEVFAHSIYQESNREDMPFVTINCGAIPDNLVESTLFGHEKGAFTGAVTASKGKCREADKGVLFLDEVGELKPEVQVKLLRMLQEGEVEPVGSARSVKVDVRIISATNRPLEALVKQGSFREDLYYRLQGLPVHLPPLRRRRSDIPRLALHLLMRIAYKEGQPDAAFSPCALQWLLNYHWPGNVRELKHILHRALLLSEDGLIRADDLSRWTTPEGKTPPDGKMAQSSYIRARSPSQPPARPESLALFHIDGTPKTLQEIEAEVINQFLAHYDMHVGKAAATLGIGQSTLYKKLKRRFG